MELNDNKEIVVDPQVKKEPLLGKLNKVFNKPKEIKVEEKIVPKTDSVETKINDPVLIKSKQDLFQLALINFSFEEINYLLIEKYNLLVGLVQEKDLECLKYKDLIAKRFVEEQSEQQKV